VEHFNVHFKPDDRKIAIHSGATVLEAAGLVGVILNTNCGGRGTCGKCAVIIEPSGEKVLACQHRVVNDMVVTVPQTSRFYQQRILAEGIESGSAVTPDIYEKYEHVKDSAILGIAVDIGTTTVVVKLLDMRTAKVLATETALNPQVRFGDDVISRISYGDTEAKLDELNRSIVDCLNSLIRLLCDCVSVDRDSIFEASIVGNTTMNHIFLKYPITQLGKAPYNAYSTKACDISPAQSGLDMNPEGNVHAVANIAGFVGADTTAVGLATDVGSTDKVTLVVDIGTNGELILSAAGRLYSASCAAGPAFEGARITCGSRAVDGAIEAVVVSDTDIDIDTIGDKTPASICGSGLIDAVAVMLDLGIIDSTGRFIEHDDAKSSLDNAIADRLVEIGGQPCFRLSHADSSTVVFLSQRDIREVQLAKAAIRAGIALLQKKASLADDDIEQVFLAGAFGNYIKKESALRIGLLPVVGAEKIHFVGNAACSGAQMTLLSLEWRENAAELARRIQYIEIAHQADFQSVYTDAMLF